MFQPEEVGGTLIGDNGLVVTAEAESLEWYQTHQTHVFDAIPFAPFQLLLWAVLPSAAYTGFNPFSNGAFSQRDPFEWFQKRYGHMYY